MQVLPGITPGAPESVQPELFGGSQRPELLRPFQTPGSERSLYSTLYRHVLWPGYEKLRGRQTHRLLRDAESRQWWSAERIAERQWREAQALLTHAYEHSPYYRKVFQALDATPGDFRSPADIQRLPILTKADIRDHLDDLAADNYRDLAFIHKTGGSTGTPLAFYITRETYEWRNAMTHRGYGWAGAHDGVRQFYVWGTPIGHRPLLGRLKSELYDLSLGHKIYSCFPLQLAAMPECLRQLNAYRPRVIVGYTSALECLARYILKHGGLRVRPQSIVTGAEAVNDAQRLLLQEVFQAPVFVSYGSREFKLIAMECEQHSLHVSADNLLVEIVRDGRSAKPGEMGRVLITDLHNFGMPFIRYEIGDLSTPVNGTCPCGRGLPLIGPVHGRLTDVLQTRDGRLVSGLFFPHLLKEFGWIEQYQVVQTSLDRVGIRLVTADRCAADSDEPRLRAEITEVLGTDIRLDVEYVDTIPLNATGKHRPVLSEIPLKLV